MGNHTFDHQYITKLNLTEMQQQIGGTSQAILEACGILPTVVRPPGGKVDQASLNVLATMGMPAVMWSIDTRDLAAPGCRENGGDSIKPGDRWRYHSDA